MRSIATRETIPQGADEVNVLGLAIATREAIRDMERRSVAGHVVHVASMASHRVPGPESGMYAATKFAVRADRAKGALPRRCVSRLADLAGAPIAGKAAAG